MVESLFVRGEVEGCDIAFPGYAKRTNISAHGRNCCGADYVFAGIDWRGTELGLSFLLGPGCDTHVAIDAVCRLSGRSARVARMAFASSGGQSIRAQHSLWAARRAQAHRIGTAIAARIRELGSGAHR